MAGQQGTSSCKGCCKHCHNKPTTTPLGDRRNCGPCGNTGHESSCATQSN